MNVYVATTALQDPHHIEARPSLIARARSADLVVCTGAELEIGWLPLLHQQSGNAKIQPGQPATSRRRSRGPLLEVPTRVDRSQGDVHPGGNPHIQLDPRNIAQVAAALAERLAQLDRAQRGATTRARAGRSSSAGSEAIARWEKQAAPLKGVPVVVLPQGPHLSHQLARHARSRRRSSPSPGLPPTHGAPRASCSSS